MTPSFFSFVYPTERLVVAGFIRELINYKSTFDTQGVFFVDPASGGIVRLFPVKSQLEIQALNFGLGAGLNLEKEHPLLPNIGVNAIEALHPVNAALMFVASLLYARAVWRERNATPSLA